MIGYSDTHGGFHGGDGNLMDCGMGYMKSSQFEAGKGTRYPQHIAIEQ